MSRLENITTTIFMLLTIAVVPTIIYVDLNSELKVGDCFFVKGETGRFFKVRYVLDKSYMAGRYGKRFLPKYPANQISLVSKQENIMTIDCIDRKNPKYLKAWKTSIEREYQDRRNRYRADAILPKGTTI